VSKLKGDQVMFGATVTLMDEDTDDKVKYRIVGEIEADVRSGKISITSPLARALLGKRRKDVVEVSTPGGGKSYKVVKVEYK
jgi:transcription elongation factor GreA